MFQTCERYVKDLPMCKINFPEMGFKNIHTYCCSPAAGRDKEEWKLQNVAYGHAREINSFFRDLSNHLFIDSWQLPHYPLATSSWRRNTAHPNTNQGNCIVKNARNKPTGKQLTQCCGFKLQKVLIGFPRKGKQSLGMLLITSAALCCLQRFQERSRTTKTSCNRVAKESRQTLYSFPSEEATVWARGFPGTRTHPLEGNWDTEPQETSLYYPTGLRNTGSLKKSIVQIKARLGHSCCRWWRHEGERPKDTVAQGERFKMMWNKVLYLGLAQVNQVPRSESP